MFKLSVEHIALFILAAFLLYHLTRSCGCANCVDGFNIANAKIKNSTLLFAFNKNIVARYRYENSYFKFHV